MNHKFPLRRSTRNAFSLVELLATMAISSVLLMLLAALIAQTTDGYAMSQRSVNHVSHSRAFIQLFESELSLRLPETPFIHLDSSDVSSERVAFVRTIPEDGRNPEVPGDITTSCYYVAWVDNTDQQPIPRLFRKILNPAETQAFIEAGKDAKFPEVDPNMDEPVIDAVVGFQATPMYLHPETGNDEPWNQSIKHSPSHIKLSIRTLDESFARRITRPSEWNRISVSPTDKELRMIRTVSRDISMAE